MPSGMWYTHMPGWGEASKTWMEGRGAEEEESLSRTCHAYACAHAYM